MKARLPFLSLAVLVLFALPFKTFGDQITFNITGTFAQEANPAITGNFAASITIDNTAGDVVSFQVTTPAPFGGACIPNINAACTPGATLTSDGTGGYILEPVDSSLDELRVDILQSSLVGVTALTQDPNGFSFFQDFSNHADSACFVGAGFGCNLANNLTISPAIPTPEPNTALLSAFGMAALALFGLRRRSPSLR